MQAMSATRAASQILLIDDHALIRSGLRMVVQSGVPGAVLREAGSIAEALREADVRPADDAPAYQPNLVLLDIELPGLNGLDGLTVLRKRWPEVPVVMLSSHTEPETVRDALARGAAAYVAKSEPSEKIIAAVDRALRGAAPANGQQRAPADEGESVEAATGPRLTPRQCEVLGYLCEGLSNKVIGRKLDLSENTVRGHVQAVLAHLQVSSRSEAAFAARQRGLVR